MEIDDWRKKIDEMDEQIVQLINQRAEAARAIGELKRNSALPVYEPQREQQVFDQAVHVVGALEDGLQRFATPLGRDLIVSPQQQ